MKAEEFVQFIDIAQALTGRSFDDHDVYAWRTVVGDLPFSLVRDAIQREVRSSDKFVSASSVRLAAAVIARDRFARVGNEGEPPSGLTAEQYLTWKRARRDAILEGKDGLQANQLAAAAVGVRDGVMAAKTHPIPSVTFREGPRVIEQARADEW